MMLSMDANKRAPQQGRSGSRRWNWLLLLPLALLIYPGLYTRLEPVWLGFPFFYWYQFAVVMLTAALTGLVYWMTRRQDREEP